MSPCHATLLLKSTKFYFFRYFTPAAVAFIFKTYSLYVGNEGEGEDPKIARVKVEVDALIAMGPQERKRPNISPLAFQVASRYLCFFYLQ